MMGSPFYYDVLFDEGPGDVVFHDCMWSGICTCCIQLLHQDSYYYTNESPDLKADLSSYQQQLTSNSNNNNNTNNNNNNNNSSNNNNNSTSCLTKESHYHHHQHNNQHNFNSHIQHQDLKVAGHLINHHHNYHLNDNNSNNHHNTKQHLDSALALSSDSASPVTASSLSIISSNNKTSSTSTHNNNRHTSSADKAQTSSSTSISPDTASSSNSTSPDTASSLSNGTSPKPVRRREHNDSERKRRDHLRNAFNFLRDQVPRFKAINKKPPRIQILHEATLYVKSIMKESQELERRLEEEKAKHERLRKL